MKKLLFLAALWIISLGAYAQIETPVKWSYGAKKINGDWYCYIYKSYYPERLAYIFNKCKGWWPYKNLIYICAIKRICT